MLTAESVVKSYSVAGHQVQVLKGASFSVERGESVAIVGPSGAGKSTLLHIAGGLGKPDSGIVIINGKSLYAQPAAQRTRMRALQIGFVFQSYHLLPELDVLENTFLPAMAGQGAAESLADIRRRGADLLRSVGLLQRAHHRPMELSGGEQQRLAIARAMMNDPELILADEPTGNLDSDTGRQVLDCLFGLTQDRKRTLVIVTHDATLAARCDRTLSLVDGKLAQEPAQDSKV